MRVWRLLCGCVLSEGERGRGLKLDQDPPNPRHFAHVMPQVPTIPLISSSRAHVSVTGDRCGEKLRLFPGICTSGPVLLPSRTGPDESRPHDTPSYSDKPTPKRVRRTEQSRRFEQPPVSLQSPHSDPTLVPILIALGPQNPGPPRDGNSE